MDDNVKKRNEVLAQTVIKGLQSRNMSGYYAEDKEAALKQALELIDEESNCYGRLPQRTGDWTC